MEGFFSSMMAMKFLVLIIVISGTSVSESAAAAGCGGPEEVRKSCGQPIACQDFCNPEYDVICLEVCSRDCSCADGYIREYQGGPCIPKSLCLPAQT